MKTPGKLKINPEKLMKNEELMTLRGGYSGGIELWCLAGGPTCVLHNMPGNCDWVYNDTICRIECPNYIGAYYCFSE
ncbi:MAG TPA: hypothetical protein DFI01_02315 [Bacteroidales bacterium]|nr:hypothetical protein [Bacteroidales bacterium]